MKVKFVGPFAASPDTRQFLSSLIVNDTVAIDAGSLGYLSPLEEQKPIEHVFLSHTHIDHIGSLPIFLDNSYQLGADCPKVYGSTAVLSALQSDFFNDRIWPDLVRLGEQYDLCFAEMHTLKSEQPVELPGLTVTPIKIDHVVPTMGFLLDDGETAIAVVSDTGPTDRIWEVARSNPRLKGVFLESSFPNELAWLAEKAKHLTPSMFKSEIDKLGREVHVVAVHIKPVHYHTIVDELKQLGLKKLTIGEPGSVVEF